MVFKHETKVLKHRNLFKQRLGQVFKRLLFKHNGFCSNTFAFAFDVVVPGRTATDALHTCIYIVKLLLPPPPWGNPCVSGTLKAATLCVLSEARLWRCLLGTIGCVMC